MPYEAFIKARAEYDDLIEDDFEDEFGVYDYYDAEEFYDDHQDEFDSYDEAEDHFNEAWDRIK